MGRKLFIAVLAIAGVACVWIYLVAPMPLPCATNPMTALFSRFLNYQSCAQPINPRLMHPQ